MNRHKSGTKSACFKRLKVGQYIYDTWYGSGTVIAKKKTRCIIKIHSQSEAWTYDMSHIRMFIE
jgi:hypothetical protein